ncbi:hypothetical protein BG011_003108 [Mortierella polycephala]|uniref:PROP1-like PPR domain-containing protein n=1 Tax=Mortierella polycephala TaxID=41804 RepID=A0A9P6U419_9FUNG|nr:hypothetical protein BG011_003108 [Mortierella polycephala]
MHALKSNRLALSKHGSSTFGGAQPLDSRVAAFMIRLLCNNHEPPHHTPRIPLRKSSFAFLRAYHSTTIVSFDRDRQHSTSAQEPQDSRPTISSFLAPPGTEKHYSPYETIADSFRSTENNSTAGARGQTIFSGRHPSDFDPIAPKLLLNDAVNSRNAQQVWHTYTRLISRNTTGRSPPFSASLYFRILHCFQSKKTAESAKWALKVYKDMTLYYIPRITTLNTMLDILIRHEDVNWTIDFFYQNASYFKVAPTPRSYNIMIRGLATKGQFKAARKIYSDMRLGVLPVQPDISTYSTLMSLYAKKGMQDEATRVLDDMYKDQVKPNIWIFNTVIKRCVNRKDYVGANKVIELMRESNIQPDIVTYSTLIDSYAKEGNEDAIANIQAEMAANQIYPNAKTITSTIKTFARIATDSDIDARLEGLLKSLPAGEMHELTYGVLMHVYGKRKDLEAAMGIYQHIISKGQKVNDVIVNSLLHGHILADQIPTANKIFHDHFTSRGFRPSTSITYSIMITGCCKQGSLNDALHYYHEMNKFQLEPDTVICSRLIQLYLEHHQHDNARRILRLMRNAKMDISVHTFTMLMDHMSSNKDTQGALRYYQEMLEAGVRPDVHCFTVLINTHLRAQNYAACDRTFESMIKFGVQPTLQTFTSMIHVHSAQGNLDKVREHWSAIIDSGRLPDLISFTLLMQTYGQQGNIEMVEHIFKEIDRKRIKIDVPTVTTLINAYSAMPRLNIGRVEKIVNMMEDLELRPTTEYFRVLFNTYGRHGLPDRVVKTWRQLQSLEQPLDWIPPTSNLLHLIEACRDRGYTDILQSVWHAATMGLMAQGQQASSVPSLICPSPDVFTSYLNALLTHNRFREIGTLLREDCPKMRMTPRAADFDLLFTSLAQYGFLEKELKSIRSIVVQQWPGVTPTVDQIIKSTRRI